jgi:hypothetical protein
MKDAPKMIHQQQSLLGIANIGRKDFFYPNLTDATIKPTLFLDTCQPTVVVDQLLNTRSRGTCQE